MSAEAAAAASRLVDVARGARIEVRIEGQGAPLLLLHGVGGNADVWRGQFAELRTSHTLIAWNAPGYGRSTSIPEAVTTVEDYANSALALLDALQIDKADVLGHSMGGLVAARLAADAPGRVRGLVLADCSSGHRSYEAAARDKLLATRLSQDDSDPWTYAAARAPKLLSPGADPALVAVAVADLARLRQPGFGQASRMVADADIFDFSSRIQSPTAVICGSEDSVTTPALNQRIAASISGALYHPIDKAGHWSFLERPARFNQLVNAHLSAVIEASKAT